MRARTTFGDALAFIRYTSRLRGYLRRPLTASECRRIVEQQVRNRGESFLRLVESRVYAWKGSPYRPLLAAAGAELGDVAALVRRDGVEPALEQLYDAGVYITLEEFKGRKPIERFGLELTTRPEDFRSPMAAPALFFQDQGSRGVRRWSTFDFAHLAGEAAYQSVLFSCFELSSRPYALWHTVPPGRASLNDVLRVSKLGKRIDRWFSQTPPGIRGQPPASVLLTRVTVASARRLGLHVPAPEYAPLDDPAPVVRWLAARVAAGEPAFVNTVPSSAVRAAVAADAEGLDISGTVFRCGGEPYTEPKAQALRRAGCVGISHYAAAETGWIGVGCREPRRLDDVHLLLGKLGVIQRRRAVAGGVAEVGALVYTTLRPTAPFLLLNVETDDYGFLEERACGCLFGELGLKRHLHGIHSYDKLTSNGMTFLGSDVVSLVDRTLPSRFGGSPTDYQLVEHDEGGIPRVSIVVSPRVGPLDEREVVETVLSALSAGPAYKRMMAHVWKTGSTLTVVRRDPHLTATAKILPLHVLQKPESPNA